MPRVFLELDVIWKESMYSNFVNITKVLVKRKKRVTKNLWKDDDGISGALVDDDVDG